MYLLKKLIRWHGVLTIDHKKIQSIESIETYAYGTSKDLDVKRRD